jgi:hypothetical protein
MAAFAAALTSAIPIVEKVISAIWSSSDKSKKTKKDATDAPAVSALKQSSGEALKSVSDQLSLVSTVLEACFPAEDAVVSMQAVLAANGKGTLSDDDKLALQKWWDNAKKGIQKISDKDTIKSVKALDDTFTRSTFLKVIDADTDDIDEDLKRWAVGPLTKDLDKIYGLLDAVNDVAVQVALGISQGLEKLSAAQNKPSDKS